MGNFPKRLLGFAFLVLAFLALVTYRLFVLQILEGEKYARFSQFNSLRKIRIPAPRGKILDRQGRVLAENRPAFVLSVLPAQVKDASRMNKTLAYLLEWNEEEVQEKWRESIHQPPFTPFIFERGLDRERVARIRGKISKILTEETGLYDLNGIHLQVDYERIYPGGKAMGHLLGYLREASEKDLKTWDEGDPGRVVRGEKLGIRGVEKEFEKNLRGFPGIKHSFVDAMGREVDLQDSEIGQVFIPVYPKAGEDIKLTIDKDLNRVAYQAFGDKVGSLVALDPRNGEILAMVSVPSYQPEELSGLIPKDRWEKLRDNPENILLNRPLQAAYPPGSTYKIVTAIAALAEGKVSLSERIHCPGYYRYGGRNWGCWKKSGHGSLNFKEALMYSCDVYFYKLGERLGPDRLARYARMLGLGSKTGILEDWERSGLVPTSDWKKQHRHAAWKNSDNLGNAIGQGYNLVTPLQNALMMARFANGGKEITPHLLLATSEDGETWKENPVKTPDPIPWSLKQRDYDVIKEALVGVVNDGMGTGRGARISGVKVGGKTGTAQVVSLDPKGKNRGGRQLKDHAWFVAFAPAENPEIALAVIVEHGGSGGRVAAPIAREVLAEYFKNMKEPGEQEPQIAKK